MPSSNNSATTSSSDAVPDKGYLYGVYQAAADWRDNLYRKACHKSLDIAEDDMGDINAPKTTSINNGLGWKELLAFGGLALGGYWLLAERTPEPTVPPVVPAIEAPPLAPPPPYHVPDNEYEVRFYDAHGNLIDVEPWPGHPPSNSTPTADPQI